MSNSKLVVYRRLSPNYSSRYGTKIDTITIHHCAGVLSLETIGNIFSSGAREASANYGIDSEGRVGQYVYEENRAWTSSNGPNDRRAVTIEVSNSSTGGQWPVSDKALEATINLCVDICRRNGIKALNYTGDTTGNMTMHCWFAATACVPTYSEVLTRQGWKRIDEVEIGEEIACATLDGMGIVFDQVQDLVPVKKQDTYEMQGLTATKDHRMVYRSQYDKNYRIAYYRDLLKDCESNQHYIPLAGHYKGKGLPLTDDLIRFFIAVQADGHYMYETLKDGTRSHYGIEFHLAKERKIERLKDILEATLLPYRVNEKRDGTVSIRIYNDEDFNIKDFCEKWLDEKRFTWQWLEMDAHQAEVFLEEVMLWDGCTAGKKYTSNDKQNLDIVNAIASLHEKGSRVIGNDVMFRDSNHITVKPAIRKAGKADTEVTCVTVNTGLFLMRQRGKTFIVGNCPGPYLKGKFPYIAQEVNKRLKGDAPVPAVKKLEVDGLFGELSTTAMQKWLGTYPDGIISDQLDYLKKHWTNLISVEYGDGGSPMVKTFQAYLNKQINAKLEADGYLGPATIKAWQKWLNTKGNKLEVDGYFGTLSAKAMQTFLNTTIK